MEVIDQLVAHWGPPLPEAVNPDSRGPPTKASSTAAHRADVRLRRCIADAIGKIPSPEGKAAAAARLNSARKQLLAA